MKGPALKAGPLQVSVLYPETRSNRGAHVIRWHLPRARRADL